LCTKHLLIDNERFCETPSGGEVEVVSAATEGGEGAHKDEGHSGEGASKEQSCHFHAGVEQVSFHI